jgi:hypothetical protein
MPSVVPVAISFAFLSYLRLDGERVLVVAQPERESRHVLRSTVIPYSGFEDGAASNPPKDRCRRVRSRRAKARSRYRGKAAYRAEP